MWTLIWLVTVAFGGQDGLESTDRLVPESYKGNPWGPEANHLRETGVFPPIPMTDSMKKWDAWGRRNLRDGDILFRLGDARALQGRFPFSRFLSRISGSPFSHTGIVEMEQGAPFVYDMTNFGPRRQPLHVWVLDNIGAFGVKRVKPDHADVIPKALKYCRDIYERQVPFDFDLQIDDRALYCVEMTEKAYRASGLPLSEPLRLGDMENIGQFPFTVMLILQVTDLTLEQPVYFPGNDHHGIWSSSHLSTVYVTPRAFDVASQPAGWKGVNALAVRPPRERDQSDAKAGRGD